MIFSRIFLLLSFCTCLQASALLDESADSVIYAINELNPQIGLAARKQAAQYFQVINQEPTFQEAHVVWRFLAALMMTGNKDLRSLHDQIVLSGYEGRNDYLEKIGHRWGVGTPMKAADQRILNSRFWAASTQTKEGNPPTTFTTGDIWQTWATKHTSSTPKSWTHNTQSINAVYWGNLLDATHNRVPFESLWNQHTQKMGIKQQQAVSRQKQIKGALAADRHTKTYEPGGVMTLTQSDHANFYALPATENRIAYLLRTHHMVPDRCFDKGGLVASEIQIEEGKIIAAINTEAIFYVKVRNGTQWPIVYVVKIPKSNSRNRDDIISSHNSEIKGLIQSRDLLGHLPLPRNNDWPELKFHEAIFNYEDSGGPEAGTPKTMMFLHGARGQPLYQIVRNLTLPKNGTTTPAMRQKAIDILIKMSRQFAQFENHFLVMDPKSWYSIVFFDSHGGNIFYDETTGKFSWIDLAWLGASASTYFNPQIPPENKDQPGSSLCSFVSFLFQLPNDSNFRQAALDAVLLGHELFLDKHKFEYIKSINRYRKNIKHTEYSTQYFYREDWRKEKGFASFIWLEHEQTTQNIKDFISGS